MCKYILINLRVKRTKCNTMYLSERKHEKFVASPPNEQIEDYYNNNVILLY